MVEELPERLARLGDARLGPGAGLGGFGPDRFLDLLRRRRRAFTVIEPHVNGAEAVRAHPGKHAGLKNGGLAEAGLTEQDDQRAPLGELRQVEDFLIPPVKKPALLLGIGG